MLAGLAQQCTPIGKRITTIMLAITTVLGVAAQTSDFFIQQLDNRNGLSNSSINSLFKDRDNLLWVATWDGLNMYDGTAFHVFNYSKENNYKSIGSNVIQDMIEDGDDHIWISTIEGISRYQKHTAKIQNYFYDQYQHSSIGEQEYQLAMGKTGRIFCLSSRYGITSYDAAAEVFVKCSLPRNDSKILRIAFDDSNRLWVLNVHGDLECYTEGPDHHYGMQKLFQEKTPINHLFALNGEMYYTTAGDLLYRIEPSGASRTVVMTLKHPLAAMIRYQGYYLMAWATKGYDVYDSRFQPSGFLAAEASQMHDIRVTSLTAGSEQVLWLGTDGNGIIKVYPKTKSFGTIATAENGNPYNKSVRAFCEVNGSLWFGTKGHGIITIDDFWSNLSNTKDRRFLMAPQELDNNAVYSLIRGADDLVYIGTDGKGIGLYDIRAHRFYKWNALQGHSGFPEFGSVYAMVQDQDHSLWLGTSGYGLIHLKIERNPQGLPLIAFVEKYAFNNNNTGPANDIIYALADGGNGRLWIGCRYGGLNLLDKKTRNFKTYKAFTYEGSLSNNDVLSIFRDSHNRIWVGTSYGLNCIDDLTGPVDNPVFKKFTTVNGLPNNTIHGITEDALGNIWASTNHGLVRVSPETGKLSNYQQSDGLLSNEFCDGAVWKDQTGRLFFGGTYGINFFLPQEIRRSDLLPNLLVSNMLMGGKTSAAGSFTVFNPKEANPLHAAIDRKDNFFELDLRAVSFLNAEKCEYTYFLDGYDKTWHSPGALGKIIYSNIEPGTYTLKVKWSNGEGLWTSETPLLALQVKQYPWLSYYALFGYGLLGAVLMYVFYRYRRNRHEIKQQLVLEHALRTREEELHEERITFFTYIAHELQTPLTLILGSIERFMVKDAAQREAAGKPYFLSLIHQQASKLTYLVNQLMEFRKTESGFFSNNYHNLNISELLLNLGEPFVPLGELNSLRYDMHIEEGINGWTDKDKLEKIIFNLLSNAFKYAGHRESIVFSANRSAGGLEFTVANSGCTLLPGQLEKLFDKFYSGSNGNLGMEKFGTGIGLAFVRQLVSLLNGAINVTNHDGWISFQVQLPLSAPAGKRAGQLPDLVQPGRPSYLYRSITAYREAASPASPTEHNKQALMETLEGRQRQNVLIVEDEPEIRFLLRDILGEEYIITEAEDGTRGLELLARVLPDLIICDVMMPNMGGLEFCNRVKNTPATCHIPVILLSARDAVEQHMEGYEAGADAYIAKPFQTSHLLIRARKLVENTRRLHTFFKNPDATSALSEASLTDIDRQFLLNLVELIEQHMDMAGFNAVNIEKALALSRMQLYRRLKTLTGMTPGEFIRHVRLKHAAHLLATTRLTVTEVFHSTGFNNQSYFFREFKKRYQLAPNEYRSRHTIQI